MERDVLVHELVGARRSIKGIVIPRQRSVKKKEPEGILTRG